MFVQSNQSTPFTPNSSNGIAPPNIGNTNGNTYNQTPNNNNYNNMPNYSPYYNPNYIPNYPPNYSPNCSPNYAPFQPTIPNYNNLNSNIDTSEEEVTGGCQRLKKYKFVTVFAILLYIGAIIDVIVLFSYDISNPFSFLDDGAISIVATLMLLSVIFFPKKCTCFIGILIMIVWFFGSPLRFMPLGRIKKRGMDEVIFKLGIVKTLLLFFSMPVYFNSFNNRYNGSSFSSFDNIQIRINA